MAVLGLVVWAVIAGTGGGDGGGGRGSPTTLVAPPDPNTTLPPNQLTTFDDPETGISLQYPKSWQRIEAPVRDVRLLLSAGGGNGLTVRVERTEQPTTPENIGNVEAFTEAAVQLNPSARILRKQPITLNGMPGYYYLYTFRDEETGQEGVHAHYFLFQGRKMNILVFQALPADQFEPLAPTFDQVANTFRSQPDPITSPAPASTSTTSAATTAPPR